jgi:hypothetical protein
LATRGLQPRPTCLANMEYHLLLRISQTVNPDPPPSRSAVYNYKIIKGFRPLMITLARLLDTLSLLLISYENSERLKFILKEILMRSLSV